MDETPYTLDDSYQAAISYMDAVLNRRDDVAYEIQETLTPEELVTGLTLLSTVLLTNATVSIYPDITFENLIQKLRTHNL